MKRHRHTPEQVVRKVREGERLLNDGKDLAEVLRALEISEATWNRWRGPVRRDEGERGQAAAGAGGRERPAEEAGRQPGAGHRHAQGAGRGKLLTPERRRRAVGHLQGRFGVSQRRACRVVGPAPRHPTAARGRPARTRRRGCAPGCAASPGQHPRWGWRMAWRVLRREPGQPWIGREPQAHPAAVARGGPAPPGPDPQTPPGRARAAPSGCGPSGPTRCGRSTSSSTRPPTGGG